VRIHDFVLGCFSVKLKHFSKFNDMTEALSAATASIEGKLSKGLRKFLKKVYIEDVHDQLAVADAKLGVAIKDKFSVSCVYSPAISELMRCVRSQTSSLIPGLPTSELNTMALGLAHSLSRYKLKFSPDKVDTMIIQAISLLDDLDKELNNYNMRCREWYGWHFPELGKIVTDNLVYARTVKAIGKKDGIAGTDLSSILPEEVEQEVRDQAEISMGSEISDLDILNITQLCDQILEMSTYRSELYDYLKNRMMAIAPNLTIMVGELVGARLIAHAGSLLNLAKHPSSTVQILGAEKALFRALKTRHETPKYGLIYHASLVGQTTPKNKGKVSRTLAAKTSLAVRYDALGEDGSTDIGETCRAQVEARLQEMEQGHLRKVSGTGKAKARAEKFEMKSVTSYNPAADSTLSRKRSPPSQEEEGLEESAAKKVKEELVEEVVDTDVVDGVERKPKKKKKKEKKRLSEDEGIHQETAPVVIEKDVTASPKKKKKSKKE
jgi:nucleolar protein 58